MEEGQPSITAQKVAIQRLTFERIPTDYGDPEADDALGRDVAVGATVDAESMLTDYLAARTAFFDRVVVRALDRGMRQAAIVGAGYDGRAFRYAKPGVRWFEVDHPSTQADKRARLDRLGVDTRGVTFVPADFAVDDVEAALVASGFDRARPAVFLCEGVTPYLDRPVLLSLLRAIRSVAAPSARFAITFAMQATDAESAARQAWFRERVAAVGEPERDRLDPDELTDVLTHTRWEVAETTSPRATRAGLVVLSPV